MFLIIVLLFPLLGSIITYLAGNKSAWQVAFTMTVLELGFTIALFPKFMKGDTFVLQHEWITNPRIFFSISADGLSFLMLLLTNFLVPLIVLSANSKLIENARTFYALVIFMQFALIGVFVAMDGFLYYIFWELALIPIYFIALLWGEGQDKEFRSRAIFKFFIYTIAGSLFMLVGFIYLYQHAGSFLIADLYKLNLSDKAQCFVFVCFFLAYAIKIPILPFHTWQPDTYKEAPTVGTMLLAGIMLKMGIYSLLRWLIPVVPHGSICWTPIVLVLCIAGVIYGSIIAIKQADLKKLFAYSSIAHVGLISAGVFALSKAGFQGAVLQMIAHGINVVGLFFAAEIIYRRTNTYDIARLGGIRTLAPKFATCFMIAVLASVALPLTNGFIGEFLLLYSMYEYNTMLCLVAGTTIILGAVYMLRMYQNTMLGNSTPHTAQFADLTTNELMVFVPIIALIFIFGVYPKPLMTIAQPALDIIFNAATR